VSQLFLVERRRGAAFVRAPFSPFARVQPLGSIGNSNCAGFTLRVGAWRIPVRVSFHEGDEGVGAQVQLSDRSMWVLDGC